MTDKDPKPGARYVNGREVGRPRRPVTAAEMNAAAAQFWAQPDQPRDASQGERDLVTQSWLMLIGDNEKTAKASRVRAAKQNAIRSVQARRDKNSKRDARIRAAGDAGMTAKQIAGDKKIVGKKKAPTLSTIHRILAKPKP
jgi:hypothetical protein